MIKRVLPSRQHKAKQKPSRPATPLVPRPRRKAILDPVIILAPPTPSLVPRTPSSPIRNPSTRNQLLRPISEEEEEEGERVEKSSIQEIDELWLPPPPAPLQPLQPEENEVAAAIARLPTPKPASFRFITGVKAKRHPTIKVKKSRVKSLEFRVEGEEDEDGESSSLWVQTKEVAKVRGPELEFVDEGELEKDEEGEIDSSAEFANFDIPSQDLVALLPSPPRPFLPLTPPPLKRRVTFSSLTAPLPSRARTARLDPSPADHLQPLLRSLSSASKFLHSSLPFSTSSTTTPKKMRRLSLQPGFKIPSSPPLPTLREQHQADDFDDDESDGHATHRSSHSYEEPLREREDSVSPFVACGQHFPTSSVTEESSTFEKELERELSEFNQQRRMVEQEESSLERLVRWAEEDEFEDSDDEEYWGDVAGGLAEEEVVESESDSEGEGLTESMFAEFDDDSQ